MGEFISAIEVELLVHAYWVPQLFATYIDTRSKEAAVKWLHDHEMLKDNVITEKGRTWVDHILSIPLPESETTWKIPNFLPFA